MRDRRAKSRYDTSMSETKSLATPSSLPPSRLDLEEWNALSREEQVSRYRDALADPECFVVTDKTMDEIRIEARLRFNARHG